MILKVLGLLVAIWLAFVVLGLVVKAIFGLFWIGLILLVVTLVVVGVHRTLGSGTGRGRPTRL